MIKPMEGADSQQRKQRIGKFMLGLAVTVWVTSMIEVYALSDTATLTMFAYAIWGGTVAGLVGALRGLSSDLPKTGAWYAFNLLKSLLLGSIFYAVVSGSPDAAEHARWVTFFYGAIVYMVTRDVFHTVATGVIAASELKRKQERLERQKQRLAALIERQSESLPNPASAFRLL